MNSRCAIKLCALALACSNSVAASARQKLTSCDTTRDHTLYSWNASVLVAALKSPDGKKVLTTERMPAKGDNDLGSIRYTVAVGGKRFTAELPGFDAELSWSPDSSAFAVTETEGGGGIGYGAYIFRITGRGLEEINLSPTVAKAFGTPSKCEVPVPPNVAFIAWLDSRRVLVAAEVVPVSICKCMGMFAAYEIRLPQASIIHRYSEAEAKRSFWNLLGCELRDADGGCASGTLGAGPAGQTAMPHGKHYEIATSPEGDWKVFTNRAGWSIHYPSGWKIGSRRSCSDPTAPTVHVDFFPPADSGSDGWVMIEHLGDKPSGASVDAWFAKLKRTANLNPEIEEEQFALNGLPALRVRYRNPYSGEMESVYVISGHQTFEVEFSDDRPLRPTEHMRNYATYRRMLETFTVAR